MINATPPQLPPKTLLPTAYPLFAAFTVSRSFSEFTELAAQSEQLVRELGAKLNSWASREAPYLTNVTAPQVTVVECVAGFTVTATVGVLYIPAMEQGNGQEGKQTPGHAAGRNGAGAGTGDIRSPEHVRAEAIKVAIDGIAAGQ